MNTDTVEQTAPAPDSFRLRCHPLGSQLPSPIMACPHEADESENHPKPSHLPYTPETFQAAVAGLAHEHCRLLAYLAVFARQIDQLRAEADVDRPRYDDGIRAELEAQGVNPDLDAGSTDRGYWVLDQTDYDLWLLAKGLRKASKKLSEEQFPNMRAATGAPVA